MLGVKRAVWPSHTSDSQQRSAPEAGRPNVQVISERALRPSSIDGGPDSYRPQRLQILPGQGSSRCAPAPRFSAASLRASDGNTVIKEKLSRIRPQAHPSNQNYWSVSCRCGEVHIGLLGILVLPCIRHEFGFGLSRQLIDGNPIQNLRDCLHKWLKLFVRLPDLRTKCSYFAREILMLLRISHAFHILDEITMNQLVPSLERGG